MPILTESQVSSLKDEIRQQVKSAFEERITDFIVGGVAVSEDEEAFEDDKVQESEKVDDEDDAETDEESDDEGESEDNEDDEVSEETTTANIEPTDVPMTKKVQRRNSDK